MKLLILPFIAGSLVATLALLAPISLPARTPQPRTTGDTGSWGALTVESVRGFAELRVLRFETSTLQRVSRKEPRPYTRETFTYWRDLDVIVPVTCELGVPLDEIGVREENGCWHVTLPEARVLRTTPLYARQSMLIWKEEGNAFRELDLFPEAVRNGELAAREKCRALGMIDRATQECVNSIRMFAAVAGVPAEKLQIDVQHETEPTGG